MVAAAKGKDAKFIVKFSRREIKDKRFTQTDRKLLVKSTSKFSTVKSVIKMDAKLFISENKQLDPARQGT